MWCWTATAWVLTETSLGDQYSTCRKVCGAIFFLLCLIYPSPFHSRSHTIQFPIISMERKQKSRIMANPVSVWMIVVGTDLYQADESREAPELRSSLSEALWVQCGCTFQLAERLDFPAGTKICNGGRPRAEQACLLTQFVPLLSKELWFLGGLLSSSF